MTVRRTTRTRISLEYPSTGGGCGTLEELLLQLCLCDLDLDCLVHLLHVAALVVGVVLDRGGEERVDEGRLSKARFTSNLSCQRGHGDSLYVYPYHDGEVGTALCDNLVPASC